MLGSMGPAPGELAYYQKPFDISKVLTFTMSCDNGTSTCTKGLWSLVLADDIIETLQTTLLNRSFFDHLAFVVKAGSGNEGKEGKEGGWAVYDFDFNALFEQTGGTLFSLQQPYSFTGTWDMKDFGDKQISHMSLWARDPLTASAVPTPATLSLLGVALFAAGLASRRRS